MESPLEKRVRPGLRQPERRNDGINFLSTPADRNGFFGERKSEYQTFVDQRLAEAAQLNRVGLLLCLSAQEMRKELGYE